MNSKKTANLLTICLKAGKAVKGFDSVCDAVKNGSAFCVLAASDSSDKTIKEISFICGKYSVPLFRTELTKEKMGVLCGKITAVIAVCDKGFADGFARIVSA
ncbi:MAG: ribosomal L7Ae/L30e/S12e/Gadd45 family protein [Ruminococcus sp.]|nr:ribosomal L7Ae/L30e/S12e/Gadd45 family protein [Ruminococcus sp.]